MEVEKEVIIGIDLAALEKNPTGWACWENKQISTCHLHSGEEIIRRTLNYKPQDEAGLSCLSTTYALNDAPH